MAAISGKNGSVTKGGATVAQVRSWSLEPTAELQAYNSSSTGGFTNRVKGNEDVTGTIEVYADDGAVPDIVQGEAYDFELLVSDTGTKYSGNALVASTPIEVDIEGAALVGVSFNIEGNGEWTKT